MSQARSLVGLVTGTSGMAPRRIATNAPVREAAKTRSATCGAAVCEVGAPRLPVDSSSSRPKQQAAAMRPWVQSPRASQATGARTWIRAPGTMRAVISMHCFASGTLTCVRWQISDGGKINVERFSTRPRHTRRRGARVRGRTGNRRSAPPWSPFQISICPRRPTSRRRASASRPRRTACATDSSTTTWLRRRCCMRNARREAVADAMRPLHAAIRLADN
jgi:hypothetical protein